MPTVPNLDYQSQLIMPILQNATSCHHISIDSSTQYVLPLIAMFPAWLNIFGKKKKSTARKEGLFWCVPAVTLVLFSFYRRENQNSGNQWLSWAFCTSSSCASSRLPSAPSTQNLTPSFSIWWLLLSPQDALPTSIPFSTHQSGGVPLPQGLCTKSIP